MNQIAQYYRVLGLETNATSVEVKQAYRSLAKKWHPDRFISQPRLLTQAQQEIKKINQAYEIIKEYLSETVKDRDIGCQKVVITKKTTSDIHYQRGVELAEKEEYESAILEFSQAIKINENYLKAYQYRGFILSKLGCELRAEADFKKVSILKLIINNTSTEQDNYEACQNNSQQQINKYWQLKQTLLAHKKRVSATVLSYNNHFFISSSHDKTIKLWQTYTGQAIATLKSNTAVNSLALSRSNKILIAGNQDRTIALWNLDCKKILQKISRKLCKHHKEIIALALDNNTNTLISGDTDNLIKIWDLDKAKEIKQITCLGGNLTSIAIDERHGYFCYSGLERQLRIRAITTGKVIRSLRGDSGTSTLAFSPNGKFLAVGQLNCQILIWNMDTGQKYQTLIGHQDRISTLTFSANSYTLISGSYDKTIKLWDLKTANKVDTLHGHKDTITALSVTSDDKVIISGSSDCTIKIWQRILVQS